MTLSDSIGLDLGLAAEAAGRAAAAREAGARIARVRFALGAHPTLGEGFLDEARAAAEALAREGLRLLAIVDGDLTVAPGGAGAFDDGGPAELARAWTDELASNAARLARALGPDVLAWEILPRPNGAVARIAPARWAAMLGQVAIGLRDAGDAPIVAGALTSDENDDGVEYLHQAYRAGRIDGAWEDGSPPFDALSIWLDVLPDGGPTEDDVAAALSERTRRLWRVVENLEGLDAATRRGIYVSGVSWDANRCSEDIQGRNAWTALDKLTSDSVVRAVVWSGLVDGPEGARGLHRGDDAAEDRRRPAWRAFRDFSLYAAQIGAPPSVLVPGLAPEGPRQEVGGQAGAQEVPPEPVTRTEEPEPDIEAAAAVPLGPVGPMPETSGEIDLESAPPHEGAVVEASAAAGGTASDARPPEREITFRIPDAAAVLAEQGLTGAELDAALAAVVARYGGHEWLPPGTYTVSVPAQPEAPPSVPPLTNQDVISALYRAGGGTWAVLDKSGLLLSELAGRRDQPYSGPPIDELEGLSDDELIAVRDALQARGADPGA